MVQSWSNAIKIMLFQPMAAFSFISPPLTAVILDLPSTTTIILDLPPVIHSLPLLTAV